MRIIYSKHFPFKPFIATNLFGLVFCRRGTKLDDVTVNHEHIHTLQQREMLYIGSTLWYVIEWTYRMIKHRNFMKAYNDMFFEREAYRHEKDLDYASHRKHFAWWHEFVKKGSFLHELGEFMRHIAGFIRDDFKVSKYLYFLVIAFAIGTMQIGFHIHEELLVPNSKNGISIIYTELINISVYFLVLIPTVTIHKENWRLKQWQIWILPVVLFLINGIGLSLSAHNSWIAQSDFSDNEQRFLRSVCSFLFRSTFILLMLCVFKKCIDGKFGLLGVTRSSKFIRIYFSIFCILVPIFYIVSTTPQFLTFYPKAKVHDWTGSFGMSNWLLGSIFELCYANDFLNVESMFRGALVIGMSRWLGPRAVLPMAATYMCIHLGKPDLELCSSVFGGYLLGILAYKTKHLWGGIIIHLCIAMLFELLGFIHGL